MKTITVILTNGVRETAKEMVIDGKWVTDEASALRMADSMTNSEWKAVRTEVKN
jgi:hypothetical protein